MTERIETDDIYTRLGTLEQENASISSDIKNIASSVNNLATEIRGIKDARQTNWTVLVSFGALFFSVMIYHSNLAIIPIKAKADSDREEILRIRKWKDSTEAKLPELEKDIAWIEKTIEAKTAGRYDRHEARKDQIYINQRIDDLRKYHNERPRVDRMVD